MSAGELDIQPNTPSFHLANSLLSIVGDLGNRTRESVNNISTKGKIFALMLLLAGALILPGCAQDPIQGVNVTPTYRLDDSG